MKKTNLSSRKKLYIYGLSLVVLGSVDFIKFAANIIYNISTGYFDTTFSNFSPEYFDVVKGLFVFLYIFSAFIIFALILTGIWGMRVSKNPCGNKGYIGVSTVLFVFSALSSLTCFKNLFSGSYRFLAEHLLGMFICISQFVVYWFFIKSAKEVRKEYLSQSKNSKNKRSKST